MPNNGAPRARGADGLFADQKLVLQELTQHSDWRRACDTCGVSHDRFRRWLRQDEAFKAKFEAMFEHHTDAIRKQLEMSAEKAGEVFDGALGATKDLELELQCPHCKGDIKVTAEIPDWGTRLKAGEVILKVGRILKDVKEYEGRITIAQLPLHLQLALASYHQGKEIPPGYQRELAEAGFLKLAAGPEPEEAEWHEVDTRNEQQSGGAGVEGVQE